MGSVVTISYVHDVKAVAVHTDGSERELYSVTNFASLANCVAYAEEYLTRSADIRKDIDRVEVRIAGLVAEVYMWRKAKFD